MSLAASTIKNVRAVLNVNDAGTYTAKVSEVTCIEGYNAGDCSGKRNHVWELVQRDKLEVTDASAASSITAGGNLSLSGGDLLNASSTIAASGALTASVTNLTNTGIEASDTETHRTLVREATSLTDKYWYESPDYNPNDTSDLATAISQFLAGNALELPQFYTSTQLSGGDQSYAAVIQAGGTVKITTQNNFDVSVPVAGTGDGPSAPSAAITSVGMVGPVTVDRVQGLPSSASQSRPQKYLIETNPALTDLKQFMSSDYLLSGLGYNPDDSTLRLGDGLYEQRLVGQAVVASTGARFIDGQTSDEGQFKYLMDNAIASKDALNLSVGVALTSEQVAALTHDIVWMQNEVVDGQTVLVPVLYLAQADNRLAPNGALIEGNDVSLIAGQDLNNVGTLRASTTLSAAAGNDLVNGGLFQAGDRLDLLADNNLTNQAGGIIAGRDVSLTAANGDVINEQTVTTHESSTDSYSQQRTFLDSAARIEAANDLSISAGRDVNNTGSVLQSGGNAVINAGRDINILATQSLNSENYGPHRNGSSASQSGATVSAGLGLQMTAGRDFSAIASQISAQQDITLAASGNLKLASAADESHSYFKDKKVTAQEDHVSQVGTSLTAGGSVALSAGQDLTLVSSRVKAGTQAYLFAGGDLDLLAAQDSDYSLYDMKKKSSFGSKKTQHDEVTQVTNIGSAVTSGGNLTLASNSDQLYQTAKLDSGNDLTISSGGAITFQGEKDLHQETHTKSNSNWGWQSAKGKGSTDETLQQTEMTAKGKTVINAINGLNIDVKQINQETVSHVIDTMVKADPSLSWLKDADARGDVNWQQVKEIHDSFKYSSSGLGAGAMLAIAITMAAFVGPAAMGTYGSAGGAALTKMATTGTISLINNGGNLGAALQETFDGDNLKNYVVAGVTAGLTQSFFNGLTGTTTDPVTLKLTSPSLSTWTGVGQFASSQLLQNGTSALLHKALGQGGSLGDALQSSLVNTFVAYGFNLVGDTGLPSASAAKIGMHALMGGLAAEATGGDFKTGALAGGASEALVNVLANQFDNLPTDQKNNMLTMSSQLVGLLASASLGGDDAQSLQTGAWVARNGTQYNYLLHEGQKNWIKEQGGDDVAQARLSAAACAATHCSAEYPVDSEAYKSYAAIEALGNSDGYAAERQRIPDSGLFDYTSLDGVVDGLTRVDSTYQVGTRAGGALQLAGGLSLGAAAVPTSEFGFGLALGLMAADQSAAGLGTLINGTTVPTFGAQALADQLGITVGQAEMIYGLASITTGARGALGGLGESSLAGVGSQTTALDAVQAAQQRQVAMLDANKGFNVSPISWDSYPTIGRNGSYISDQQAISSVTGPLNMGGETVITRFQATQLEQAMGLQPGSMASGFKVRQVDGITEMYPYSPLQGNEYFQGGGQHLPGGGPEMVIESIPTVDSANVKTITTVIVK